MVDLAFGALERVNRQERAPRELAWAELTPDHFDTAEVLPVRPEGAEGGEDLFLELAGLLRRRWYAQGGDAELERIVSFADALRYLSEVERGTARVERWVELQAARPVLARDCAPWLAELALDDALFGGDWDPDDENDRDGIALADPWSRELVERAPWKDRGGSERVFQGVTLMRADLEAIKGAECDFGGYHERVGEEYDEVGPVDGSWFTGVDSASKAFVALSFAMKVPLPFPFGSYEAVVHMLNRIDASGRLVTDVYSRSPDFLWLAGRDVCMPLWASDGEWVGMLVVRRTGFDLKGVPDGDGDRSAALRAGLGNLKRQAQARFEAYGGAPRTVSDGMPVFGVVGGR